MGLEHPRAYPKAVEDLLDHSGILDGCYQVHSPAAFWAGEGVK